MATSKAVTSALFALCFGALACADSAQKQDSASPVQTESDAGLATAPEGGTAIPRRPDGELDPSGLTGVRVVVDTYGISHVYAKSDAAAFYGAGYAMARDRLFQMELIRRRALGTTAELFGERAYKDDVGSRTFDFLRLGEADYQATKKDFADNAALVEAWTYGVNHFIEEIKAGSAPVPYGFGPKELNFLPELWLPSHAFAIGKLLAFGLSNTLDHDLLGTVVTKLASGFSDVVPLHLSATDTFTMGQEVPKKKAVAKRRTTPLSLDAKSRALLTNALRDGYRFFDRASESNNWAVSGEHTQNGKPLLAGDPHQPTSSPGRLWPFHMSTKASGGSLDVIGFAFAGTPAVQLGHNDRVGWTATTNFADVMDLWSVNISGDDVSLGGEKHTLKKRVEKILVRKEGSAVGTNETREITVKEVPGFGVILPDSLLPVPTLLLADFGDEGILLGWTGFAPTHEMSAYVAMDRARHRSDLEKAIDLMNVGAINVVGADERGITYHVHADVPDRGDPRSHPMPWRVISGANKDNLWTRGFLGADRLPHMRDPARGFIATANNDPWGHTGDGDVENDPFYFGSYYAKGMRAARITEVLSTWINEGKKLDVADMQALQRDVHSTVADALLPVLERAMAELDTRDALSDYRDDLTLRTLAQGLLAWDRKRTLDSGEALAFLAFEWFCVKRAFGSRLGDLVFDPVAEKSPPYLLGQLVSTLRGRYEGANAVLGDDAGLFALKALSDARDFLIERYKHADLARLSLAQHHAVIFDNSYGGAISAGRFAVPGGSDTVNVSEAAFFKDGKPLDETTSHQASLYRMVLRFNDDGSPQAFINTARGTSEDPRSPHFDDLHEPWLKTEYFPLPFHEDDVKAQMESSYELMPPSSP